ncbi:MAG: efflux RND transporter periplasmic adaptor subunit, partial [Methylomonas sp.]
MSSIPNSSLPLADSKPLNTLSTVKRLGWLLLLLLIAASGWRLAIRHEQANQLQQRNLASLQRNVIIARPKSGETLKKIVLPATLRGNSETQIYARSNGYLHTWYKTIGDQVKKGDLLAVIDVPELAHELAQGRATLAQVKARLELARSTLKRWTQLNANDSAPQQEFDEKRSAVLQAESDLSAAESNVKRLENIENYRRIVAPFDGVITRRSIEVGSLINPGTQELFAISQVDPLRLTVWVPQIYANEVKVGQEVSVRLVESQAKTVNAHIDHIAGGLDPINRSRQVDITLANPDGKLLPGSYAEITINVVNKQTPLVVPANVLVINQSGIHALVVNSEQRIEIRNLKLGRDFGREVEVLDGIGPNDILVASPSDLLEAGEIVNSI